MDLPENKGVEDQREYVIECILSAGLTDEGKVPYNFRRFHYELQDDTWLPLSDIRGIFFPGIGPKLATLSVNLKRGDPRPQTCAHAYFFSHHPIGAWPPATVIKEPPPTYHPTCWPGLGSSLGLQ